MLSVIGKKVGMTAIFTENGKKEACTVVSCEPNFITQIKSEDKDGYSSVQIASIEKKEKSSNKRKWVISRKQILLLRELY